MFVQFDLFLVQYRLAFDITHVQEEEDTIDDLHAVTYKHLY